MNMPATPSHTIRIASCEVAGRTFGLDMAAIVGIQPSEVVRFDSSIADEVIGTMASHGQTYPVYSLARLLGLPHTPSRMGHCIVVTDGVHVWGMLADRVSRSETRSASEVMTLPALITGSTHSMIRGVMCGVDDQSQPLIVLDPERIRPGQLPSPATEFASSPTDMVEDRLAPSHRSTQQRLITFAAASGNASPHIRYAFSVTQVVEITRVPQSITIPGSPAFIAGIASWRHSPLPLVRLTSDIDSDGSTSSSQRMAVVRVPECTLPLGLLVSPECEILNCPLEGTRLSASQVGVHEHSVRALFRLERHTLLFPRFSTISGTV